MFLADENSKQCYVPVKWNSYTVKHKCFYIKVYILYIVDSLCLKQIISSRSQKAKVGVVN